MTIIEAINKTDSLKPNDYTHEEKTAWLSTLDGQVKSEITDSYEGSENFTFNGYNKDTSPDTVLLIPAPYEDAYISYLQAQIDFANGEIAKYNNNMAMFNSSFSSFTSHYNRTHMPKGRKVKYF